MPPYGTPILPLGKFDFPLREQPNVLTTPSSDRTWKQTNRTWTLFFWFVYCLFIMIFMFLILHVINRQIYSECVNEDISFNLRVLNSQIQLLIYWLWLTDYIFFHSEIQVNSLIQDFNSDTGGHLESQHRGHLVDECETKLECELNWRTLVLRNVSKTHWSRFAEPTGFTGKSKTLNWTL